MDSRMKVIINECGREKRSIQTCGGYGGPRKGNGSKIEAMRVVIEGIHAQTNGYGLTAFCWRACSLLRGQYDGILWSMSAWGF